MERLGIIGYGIVGSAVEYGFKTSTKRKHEIYIYDKYKAGFESLENVVNNSDIIFICLPTPMRDHDYGIDLSIINENIDKIGAIAGKTSKIIAIKSTVIPGTTRDYAKKYPDINFCFNPEFLTEANHLEDFVRTDRNIVGADNDLVRRRVGAIYTNRFPRTSLYYTDPTTAEFVKYMANCLLATKVMIANEFYDVCQKMDVSYDEVRSMVSVDPRIGKSHLNVTSERGFGGKCFPKDLAAIIGLAIELGIDVSVLEAVWCKNLEIRRHKDWEEIPGAVAGGKEYTDENNY